MAWVMPPISSAHASSPISNGGFDTSSGWTIIQNGGSGVSFNSALRFSYMTGEVSQTFAVTQGDTLEVSFTVDNSVTNSIRQGAIADIWAASLVAGNASTNAGRSDAHGQEIFTLTLTVPAGISLATLDFSGKDNGFWAGQYGPVIDSVSVKITPAATSLVVTSLADDGSEGTLRWAINQANATSGGIYDSISFAAEGTITLTSSLPAITQSVTIIGSGMSKTIIDGNNQFRSIYNNGSRSISISDLTFKRGANATGGIVWSNNGTFTITNVKFTDSQNYSWYQQNNTVTTFESCQFTNLAYAIRSDYGGTPSVKSDDSAYGDRIYINNSQFLNNTYGLATERFVRISNSVFSNNFVAAQMQGLNRIQVYGSTFNNNATAIYVFSWIPTSWVPGADNQVIEGNTFSNNSSAINFNNYFSNGTRVINGNNANSFSTARSNSFSENGTIYSGSGFVEDGNTVVTTTTTTTTTLPPPTTTTTTSTTTTTTSTTTTTTTTSTTTTIPETTTTEPETTTTEPETVVPETTTTTTIPESPPTGTTTTTTAPVEEETPVETSPSTDNTESDESTTSLPQYAPETTTETTVPEVVVPDTAPDVANIGTEGMSTTALASVVNDVLDNAGSAEDFGAAVNDLLDNPLTNDQLAAVVDQVFSPDISDAEFASAVDAVFDKPLTDEQFSTIIDAMLDEPLTEEQLNSVVDALGSDTVTEEQAQEAVDKLAEDGVDATEATAIATSAEVLNKITADQASEIFDAVPVSELTDEQAAAIVEAVTNAPNDIKEAFQEQINIFGGKFDEYVATGSAVSVGARRVIVAATGVLFVAPTIAAATPPSPAPNGGGGSGGGSDGGNSDGAESDNKQKPSRRRRNR